MAHAGFEPAISPSERPQIHVTTDQSDAETFTWQNTTPTTDRHPRPMRDSNPQSQQASGLRSKPETARPLWSAFRQALRGKTTKREVHTSVTFSISLFQLWQNSLRHIWARCRNDYFPSIIFSPVRKTCTNLLIHHFLELWHGMNLKSDFRRCAPDLCVQWMTVRLQDDMKVMHHLSNMASGGDRLIILSTASLRA